jgi:uncharacterized protein YbjT (DUF2867 family)
MFMSWMPSIDCTHGDRGRTLGLVGGGVAVDPQERAMYVVAGVTGNTGKVVADALLAQKKPVRVIVRDAKKGEPWKARGAEVAVAELDDAAALTAALRGAEGAYLLLPPNFGSTSVRADNARRTKAFVDAIDASGVKHVVLLSSVGAQHADGTGPIASLHDAEIALAKTRAAVTFVRASYFMENTASSLYALGDGALPGFLKLDVAIPMVATDDIGAVAAKALLEGGKGKSVIELAGPRDYSPRDVAAALTRILGKTITAQLGPESAIVPALKGAGMNDEWAALYRDMIVGVNSGHVAFEGGAARALRGPTDLDVVLRRLTAK